MKRLISTLLLLLVLFSFLSCTSNELSDIISSHEKALYGIVSHKAPSSKEREITHNTTNDTSSVQVKSKNKAKAKVNITIEIGKKTYNAVLLNNKTTKALIKKLPLTLDMGDMNSNEKYYFLPYTLPTNAKQVNKINSGDLMLYGSDCLVLFYDDFNTSYSYTKIGYVKDASKLADVVGDGDVKVTFAISK